MNAVRKTICALRQSLSALQQPEHSGETGRRFGFGCATLDAEFAGGLRLGALHEVFAASVADAAASAGFVAGLACRAAAGKHLLWVRQAFSEIENGALHAPGLMEFGLDPAAVLLVKAPNATGVLRGALEGVRCSALAAVIVEPWGNPKVLDLTATRRLALAAEQSGVTIFLMRVGAAPAPSAAMTRWRVKSGASRPLAANAPGHPAYDITLLRHRAGYSGCAWHVEWDRDEHVFREVAALPGAVVPLSADRPGLAIRTFARAG